MASYPKGRLKNPFPYFTEVMTGFEYAAAIGMIYEDMTGEGLRCIRDIRNRYDGRRRNPFDEAECGHHYARAMASWAAPLALTGFRYSAVDRSMAFLPRTGCFFWSSGGSWGTCTISRAVAGYRIRLRVSFGILRLSRFILSGYGHREFGRVPRLREGRSRVFRVAPDRLPEDAQEASGRTRRRGIG
jgi:hypothetical protein